MQEVVATIGMPAVITAAGGGGGNGSIGGFGGYGWSGAGWPAGIAQDLRGIGGAAFTQNSTSRLVMGGGGGAGANNNSAGLTSSGGAGGGIVMIRAGTMTGTGTINANGAIGQTQLNNDSGGGGGAGGSVLVNTVSNTVGALTINAIGGRGGDGFAPGNTGHAGAGGGGGGVAFSDGGISNLTGGANGVTNVGDCPTTGVAPCSSANGATRAEQTQEGVSQLIRRAAAVAVAICVPNLAVTKSTTTPFISVAGATTATYTISVITLAQVQLLARTSSTAHYPQVGLSLARLVWSSRQHCPALPLVASLKVPRLVYLRLLAVRALLLTSQPMAHQLQRPCGAT